MNFYFIVEDKFGPSFIKQVFRKKFEEGLFSGRISDARRSSISNKMTRMISAAISSVDRIIILMDADGRPLADKEEKIKEYVAKKDLDHVRIVLLDNEIEEWICYSLGIKTNGKPSDALAEKNGYQKRDLLKYASKIDCTKLKDCQSFNRLISALN